jgi:hypothetical protein
VKRVARKNEEKKTRVVNARPAALGQRLLHDRERIVRSGGRPFSAFSHRDQQKLRHQRDAATEGAQAINSTYHKQIKPLEQQV